MTLVSLSLMTTWMALVLFGVTFAGFVHALVGAAVTIVLMSGNRGTRRARAAAAAAAAVSATTMSMR